MKGAPWADLSLLEALRARGHEVDESWDVGTPRRIRHDNMHLLFEAPRKCEAVVASMVASRRPEVVLINQPLGWKAGRRLKAERPSPLYVARSHGWEPRNAEELATFERPVRSLVRRAASNLLRRGLHWQNQAVLRWADGVVVGSTEDRDWIVASSGFSPDCLLALPPGVPEEFLATPAPPLTPERAVRVLYVGQFAGFKAPEVVAAAMAAFLVVRADAEATWVCGREDDSRVQALFPEPLRARVSVRSWMSRTELAEVYDRHGLFLFPSHFEGFGQTFLEAMARGLVVLATNVGGMRETIRSGENGVLFDRGRPAEMAACAVEIASLPCGELAALGARARASVEARTWAAAASQFEAFVCGLMAGASGKSLEIAQNGSAAHDISIVIPTLGREAILLETIRALLDQEEPAQEILIVDQTPEHDPATTRQLDAWNDAGVIRWVRRRQASIPGAMNEGLRQARSPIVLFLDDDIVPLSGLVSHHREAHLDESVAAVTGLVLQPGEGRVFVNRPFRRGRGLERDLRFPFHGSVRCDVANVMAGNLSVKRSKALEIGGFDERFVAVAYRFETEFCRRLLRSGGRVVFEPEAGIKHLRASAGGTRTWGGHQTSPRPAHSIGDYYFALLEGRGLELFSYVVKRVRREALSRFHLARPWWIPVKLVGEARGFMGALRLARERRAAG